MFAARGALQRRLRLRREEDEREAEREAERNNSLRSGSRNDDNGHALPADSTGKRLGDGEAHDAAAADEDETDEVSSDDLVLLPLTGLTGAQRKYVQFANTCRYILNSKRFTSVVMLCISWASLSVGLQTYDALATSPILDGMDLGVLAVFILECVLKIFAEGLVPWRFFTGPEMRWNNFDFVIIVLSLPMWGSALGGGNIAILRMLRLLRIMKLVKRVPQLYMIIMGLIGGLKSIGYILLLLFLVFYLYAISGMYAWADNDQFHFRNVPIAMITLFRMSTLENWSNVMNINFFGCDRFRGGYYSDDPADAPNFQYCNVTQLYGANATDDDIASARLLNNIVATFYFITFILISAFVMLSLFIGAITMSMTQSMENMKAAAEEIERKERIEKAAKRTAEAQRHEREKLKKAQSEHGGGGGDGPGSSSAVTTSEKLSNAQKRERQKMRAVLMQTWDDCDLTGMLGQSQGDNKSWRGRYQWLASHATKIAEHARFTGFVTLVICLAGIMVGLQTSNDIMDAIGHVLAAVDSMILAVFTTECVIKIIAEGFEPWLFFRSGWNTFDFIIVVGSFTRGKGGMLTMLRLLRLLRVLKLVRAFPQLQVIVSALMKGVGSIGYIGLILLLCFYVFGIIGNMLFAQNDPFHFQYLHFAMITLFQCATMDGWSDVLYINYYGCDNYGYDDYRALGYTCTSQPSGFLAVVYFGCFTVLGGMVLITLFIGVVTTSMEEATQEMEAEQRLLKRVEDLRVRKGVEQGVITSYMQVFKMLDLDGSGSVEEAELRIGLAAIGKYPSYEELKEMMDVVDEDGSGQIDIVEFVEFMIHVREKSAQQRKEKEELQASGETTAPPETVKDETPVVNAGVVDNDNNTSTDDHGDRIRYVSYGDGMGDETTRNAPSPFVALGEAIGTTATSVVVEKTSIGLTPSLSSPSPVGTPRTSRGGGKYKIVPSG